MTTPRVTELPRRLEATSRDTFLTAGEDAGRNPLAPVVELRPRDPLAPRDPRDPRRPPRARRTPSQPRRPQPTTGPGGNAA